jgi:hypothetical protein
MGDTGAGNGGGGSNAKWWVTGIIAPVVAGLLIWYLTGSNSPFNHPTPGPSQSSAHSAYGSVEVPAGLTSLYAHTIPSLTAPSTAALSNGATVQIECTAQGEAVDGSSLWDWIGMGYLPDAYVYTGTDQPTMPNC